MADKKCSFCNKPENEVKNLVGKTNGAQICDRCAMAVNQVLEQNGVVRKKARDQPLGKPLDIKATLDQHVIAQDQAKIDVAIAIYNHYKRRGRKAPGYEHIKIKKSNILIPGPSGTGKTEIARTIAEMLNVPFYVADCTKLTSAGYVGDDVENVLQGLITAADGDIERAEWGIVVLDEIDKLARKSGRGASGYRDVTGEGAQQAMLKMVEGAEVLVPRGNARFVMDEAGGDLLDTTNILFIGAGSFAGIEEVVSRRVNKSATIGFGSGGTKRDMTQTEVYQELIEEDVLEFGIIPELAGRMPIITCCLPLTEDEMVRILTEPKNAIIKQFKARFALDGIDLTFDEEALRWMGREANERPTGARALRSIVEHVMKPYSYESPSDATIRGIHITGDVVENDGEAMITRGPPPQAESVAMLGQA